MKQIILSSLIVLIFVSGINAQATKNFPVSESYVDETITRIGKLKVPINRARMRAGLASQLFAHDPKKARALYDLAITDLGLSEKKYNAAYEECQNEEIDADINGLTDYDDATNSVANSAMEEYYADGSVEPEPSNTESNIVVERYKSPSSSSNEPVITEKQNICSGELRYQFQSILVAKYFVLENFARNDWKSAYKAENQVLVSEKNKEGYERRQFLDAIVESLADADPVDVMGVVNDLVSGNEWEKLREYFPKFREKNSAAAAEIEKVYIDQLLDKSDVSEEDRILFALSPTGNEVPASAIFSPKGLARIVNAFVAESLSNEFPKYKYKDYAEILKTYAPKSLAKFNSKNKPKSAKEAGRVLKVKRAAGLAEAKDSGELNEKLTKYYENKLSEAESAKLEAKLDAAFLHPRLSEGYLNAVQKYVIALAKRGKKQKAEEIIDRFLAKIDLKNNFSRTFLDRLKLMTVYSYVNPNRSFELLENSFEFYNPKIELVREFLRLFETGDDGNEEVVDLLFGETNHLIRRNNNFSEGLINLARADIDRFTKLADRFATPETQIMARMVAIEYAIKAAASNP